MVDAEDLKNDGYDLCGVAHCCELAMIGLSNAKSKESKVVLDILEALRDECESHECD